MVGAISCVMPVASGIVRAQHEQRPSPPPPAGVGAAMVTYFGVLHFPLGVQGLSVVAQALHQDGLDPPTKAVSLVALQTLELAGSLWLVRDTIKDLGPPASDQFRFSLAGDGRKWASAASAGAALLLLTMATSSVGVPSNEDGDGAAAVHELITGEAITTYPTLLVYLGITPFMEEYIYRGFVLGSLSAHMSWPAAITISSFLFALSHFTISGFPGLFLVGSVLGLAYLWTGNLAASFVIHSLYNIVVLQGLLR